MHFVNGDGGGAQMNQLIIDVWLFIYRVGLEEIDTMFIVVWARRVEMETTPKCIQCIHTR